MTCQKEKPKCEIRWTLNVDGNIINNAVVIKLKKYVKMRTDLQSQAKSEDIDDLLS